MQPRAARVAGLLERNAQLGRAARRRLPRGLGGLVRVRVRLRLRLRL